MKLHVAATAAVSVSKTQQLLQGLQAVGDEGTQLTSVIEMCQVRTCARAHALRVGITCLYE